MSGFVPQPLQNTRLGSVHGFYGDVQFTRHGVGFPSFDGDQPERQPRHRLKVGFDERKHPPGNVLIVFTIPGVGQRAALVFEHVREAVQKVAASTICRPGSHAALVISQPVGEDRPQPTPERPNPVVVVEGGEFDRDDPENFLNEVIRVVAWDSPTTKPAVQVRGVKCDEPPPSVLVSEVTHLIQESD